MNRIWIFCLFFLPLALFSDDLFQFNFGIGYRKDKAEMSLSGDNRKFYSSTDLLNSVELGSAMRLFGQKISFSMEADVGWVVSGSGRGALLLRAPSMGISEGRFRHSSGGYFTDGQVNLGTFFGSSLWQIAPQGSFGFFYQQIKQGKCDPPICDLSHSRLKRFWFGPGIGGELIFRPHFAWIFIAEYFYYYLHFDQKFDLFSDLVYSSPSFSEYFIWQKYRASTPGQGQKISGKISAQVSADYRFNLRFDAFLFSADNKSSRLRQNYMQVFPVEASFSEIDSLHTDASWQAYSGFAEVEYFF